MNPDEPPDESRPALPDRVNLVEILVHHHRVVAEGKGDDVPVASRQPVDLPHGGKANFLPLLVGVAVDVALEVSP